VGRRQLRPQVIRNKKTNFILMELPFICMCS
jgi:hypothetical protein